MRALAILFCALVIAPVLSAQQSTQKSAQGPTLQAAAVGFQPRVAKVDASTKVNLVRPHEGQDVALMVVGVGAMIVGAIVGDTAGTIILIGGAGMALYGLYHYLE
ncbi:MAG: hypothetical protein ACJ78R_00155 [Gemmatimonadaceae bacterium]